MYGVIVALVPAILASFYFFGLGSAVVLLVSVAACVFFEWAITKYILKTATSLLDGSAIITGLLLGMNLPSNLPLWIIIIGALFAIGVGKMSFGGLGNNPFNPALVGRCFLLVSFPAQMTSWPVAGQLLSYTDATTAATPLAIMKTAIKTGDSSVLQQLPDSLSLLFGATGEGFGAGTTGEVCAIALLLGLAYMLWKKVITWHIPVSIIATVFVFSGLMHLANPVYANPFAVILSGGLMLGAIFMATDYVTSPMTHKGMLIYGVCIGLLTVIIRNWGSYPEGMSFAILIMNAFTPLINTYVKPKRFGEKPAKKFLVLVGVALVVGAVLAYVNHITSGPIAQKAEQSLAAGIKSVMGTDDLQVAAPEEVPQTIDGKEFTFIVHACSDKSGNSLGAAVESTTGGFGGDLKVLVGFDKEGKILGYTLLQHSETPGLGAKASTWFQKDGKGSIIGKTPKDGNLHVSKDDKSGNAVDAITASTITSRAFLKAINQAYAAYTQQGTDGKSGATKVKKG